MRNWLIAIACLVPGLANAAWRFEILTNLSAELRDVAINDAGQVAYATAGPPGQGDEIFRIETNGSITPIATDVEGLELSLSFLSFGLLSLRNDGAVAWSATSPGGTGIYLGTGVGAPSLIFETDAQVTNIHSLNMNGTGTFAFHETRPGVNQTIIWVIDGTGLHPLVEPGLIGVDRGVGGETRLSDAGAVAVTLPSFADSVPALVALVNSAGVALTVSDPAENEFFTQRLLDLNDVGDVLVDAKLDTDVDHRTLVLIENGVHTEIVTDAGPFTVFSPARVNELGQVVFAGTVGNTTPNGLFTGPDPDADKVIRVDDFVEGRRVLAFQKNFELNDAGQIVFVAALAPLVLGGQSTLNIVLAPEPGQLLGSALAVAILGALACTKRTSDLSRTQR